MTPPFITPSPLMEVGVPVPGNHKQPSGCMPLIGVQVALVQSLCLNISLREKLKSKNAPMKLHKKRIYNKETKYEVSVTPAVEGISRVRNVLEGREITSKDPTLKKLARCPCPRGCFWIVSANQTQSKHTVSLQACGLGIFKAGHWLTG